MRRAQPWQRVLYRTIFIVAALFFAFILSIMVVAAADQVVLDWEVDAGGSPLLSGQVIDDEYHTTEGISITVIGESNLPDGANVRAIFPSSDPPIRTSGSVVDDDLASPNQTCPGGGPGVGIGGQVGTEGENCIALGNVLILPTSDDGDGDGFIDDLPNDDAAGGKGIFLFSDPVTVDYLELVDMESPESVTVRAFTTPSGSAAAPVVEINPAPLGDNSFQRVEINASNIVRLEVEYVASGALAALAYTPAVPSATTLLATGTSTQSWSLWLLSFVVLLVGLSVYLLRRNKLVVDAQADR